MDNTTKNPIEDELTPFKYLNSKTVRNAIKDQDFLIKSKEAYLVKKPNKFIEDEIKTLKNTNQVILDLSKMVIILSKNRAINLNEHLQDKLEKVLIEFLNKSLIEENHKNFNQVCKLILEL